MLISSLDLFSTPVLLRFEKNEKTSTKLGILFSIGIIIFLSISFIASDVFYKESPTVVILDLAEKTRPSIDFSNKIFVVSIEDDNGLGSFDPLIYEIQITNYYMSSSLTGDFTYIQNVTIPIHICTTNDVPEQTYDQLGFSKKYCLDKSFEISGFWNEDSLTFLDIKLVFCNNETSGGKCKSVEEIKQYFYRKTFNIYFTDLSVDTSNHTYPINTFIHNEYFMVDLNLRKILNVFLKKIKIMTDDAYVFTNNDVIEDIIFDQLQLDIFKVDSIDDPQALFQCQIFSSQTSENIIRTYQKLAEALANIGGMASILMFAGFLFTTIEKSFDLQKRVMNALYSFQNIEIIKIKRKSLKNSIVNLSQYEKKTSEMNININDIKASKTENNEEQIEKKFAKDHDSFEDQLSERCHFKESPLIQSKEITNVNTIATMKTPDTVTNINLPSKIFPTTFKKKQITNDEFNTTHKLPPQIMTNLKKMMSNSSKRLDQLKKFENFQEYMRISKNRPGIKFNILEYMKLQFKKLIKRKYSDKEQLFLKGMDVYNKELDIVYILKKLQEFEKLKIILLNNEQLVLFNLLEKPLIYIPGEYNNHRSPSRKITDLLNSTQNLDQFQLRKIFDHYESLKKNSELSDIDKRLMELIDINLEKFSNNFQ